MFRIFIAYSLLMVFTSSVKTSLAQQTVGLFQNTPQSFNGYTLFAPMNRTTTFLIDNCGEKIHSWNTANKPALSVYLLEDGKLLHSGSLGNATFTPGGSGGIISMIDWFGNVVWSYTLSSSSECQHHDIEALPNGNILAIAWESKTAVEASQAGRTTSGNSLWAEKIVEIQPDLINGGGSVVWEWHVWDHLVQDADNTKDNFGVVGDSPELIDINFVSGSPTNPDWLHMNSVDYNPELDQIVLSCHNFSEIWVIDHSTTTAEAASHSGGTQGHGGDLLYRWGNPKTYDQGVAIDQKLFLQHDARWIPSGYPNEGSIMVFNNQVGADYSEVNIFAPPVDAFGAYVYSGSSYAPSAFLWTYQASPPSGFYSNNISGAELQPNGNTLICDGNSGRFFEVDSNGNTVWEYINPVNVSGIIAQGNPAVQNLVFRCERYATDYSGLSGYDLSPQGYIESGSTFSCDLYNGLPEISPNPSLTIYPNPASESFTISSDYTINNIKLFSSNGVLIMEIEPDQNPVIITDQTLERGIYYITVTNHLGNIVTDKITLIK